MIDLAVLQEILRVLLATLAGGLAGHLSASRLYKISKKDKKRGVYNALISDLRQSNFVFGDPEIDSVRVELEKFHNGIKEKYDSVVKSTDDARDLQDIGSYFLRLMSSRAAVLKIMSRGRVSESAFFDFGKACSSMAKRLEEMI